MYFMTPNQKINSIVIVGGGTAGWLTAGIIAAEHNTNGTEINDLVDVQITLVESPDVPTIGVGEGTWPSMKSTLQKMGISETDLIQECDASFKQGTLFNGWKTGGNDAYTHPFTPPHSYASTNLAPQWQKFRNEVSFADAVSSQNALMFQGLAPKQISTPEYAFNANYGYHLDAGKFAELLRKHCVEKLGITHLKANVIAINSSTDGDIESLKTDTVGHIAGDLFVDCSGSKALLLGEHFDIPFCSKSQFLFNDTALASQVPYTNSDDPIASSTLSTAQTSGWIWDIGLPTRRGIGHVYSSAHTTEERASEELLAYIKTTVSAEAALPTSIRKVAFNPGHRAKFWHKNCVAVGMSAGFIEPLEASALVLVELSAAMIAEQLPANRQVMDLVAKRFNNKFLYRWDRIIDFLKLHYILSQRQDSDYWKDNSAASSVPESLSELVDLWRWQSPWHRDTGHIDEMFPSASFQYVLYGMGFVTQQSPLGSRTDRDAAKVAIKLFEENANITQRWLDILPSNRELIDKINTFGLQKI